MFVIVDLAAEDIGSDLLDFAKLCQAQGKDLKIYSNALLAILFPDEIFAGKVTQVAIDETISLINGRPLKDFIESIGDEAGVFLTNKVRASLLKEVSASCKIINSSKELIENPFVLQALGLKPPTFPTTIRPMASPEGVAIMLRSTSPDGRTLLGYIYEGLAPTISTAVEILITAKDAATTAGGVAVAAASEGGAEALSTISGVTADLFEILMSAPSLGDATPEMPIGHIYGGAGGR